MLREPVCSQLVSTRAVPALGVVCAGQTGHFAAKILHGACLRPAKAVGSVAVASTFLPWVCWWSCTYHCPPCVLPSQRGFTPSLSLVKASPVLRSIAAAACLSPGPWVCPRSSLLCRVTYRSLTVPAPWMRFPPITYS